MKKHKTNPYRYSEEIIVFSLVVLLLTGGFVSVIIVFWDVMGWWSLTAPFIVSTALIVVYIIYMSIIRFFQSVGRWWSRSKAEWDTQNQSL